MPQKGSGPGSVLAAVVGTGPGRGAALGIVAAGVLTGGVFLSSASCSVKLTQLCSFQNKSAVDFLLH